MPRSLSVVEAAFAGLRVEPTGVTLAGEVRPKGQAEPDETPPTYTLRTGGGGGDGGGAGGGGGGSSATDPKTPRTPERAGVKRQKGGGGGGRAAAAAAAGPAKEAPSPTKPSDSDEAKANLQAFAREFINVDLTQPLTPGDSATPNRWANSVVELSAHKEERYAKSAEGYAEARMLAAADMKQMYKDAQADGVVTKRKDEESGSEYWVETMWDLVHENDRAKRYLLDGMTRTAMQRMADTARNVPVPDARAAVRVGIEIYEFAEEYAHLPDLLNTLNESLRAFVNQPLFLNQKMFNFLILGRAGVGKTRLGKKMGELLSHYGLYLYDTMKVAQRSDFVADFEGQTANKVRGFLAANQERVLFLDEAYALSTYEPMKPGQEKKDRKLTVYSQEAIDALNQYLSENAGSGCFIAAGYPKEMEEDFLPANKGLIRRFETTVHIENYTSERLIAIYLANLARKLSRKGEPPLSVQTVATFFTTPALGLLSEVIEASMTEPPPNTHTYRVAEQAQRGATSVKKPLKADLGLLGRIFEDQASSMVTLSDLTAMLIWTSPRYGTTKLGTSATASEATWAIGASDMASILVGQLRKQLGQKVAPEAEAQLVQVLNYYGWRDNSTGAIAAPAEGSSWRWPATLTGSESRSRRPTRGTRRRQRRWRRRSGSASWRRSGPARGRPGSPRRSARARPSGRPRTRPWPRRRRRRPRVAKSVWRRASRRRRGGSARSRPGAAASSPTAGARDRRRCGPSTAGPARSAATTATKAGTICACVSVLGNFFLLHGGTHTHTHTIHWS